MLMWGALLVLGVVMVLAASAALARRPLTTRSRPVRPFDACRAAVNLITEPLGRAGAAVAVLLAGVAGTVVVCWPLGRLARRFQTHVDHPLFRLAEKHHDPTWTRINYFVTGMGNRPQVKLVCIAAAVVLTVLWRKRQWWVPAVVIAVAFFAEKFGQQVLGKVVDRGHPPTTLGTYPSGGCARLIAIYGTILFLALLTTRRMSRGANHVLWTVLALAAFVEGYTRIYLLEHWFTDVVGGWIFGCLLLGVLVAATATWTGGNTNAHAVAPGAPAAREPGRRQATTSDVDRQAATGAGV